MVLPVPGGPVIIRWCPPADATSNAHLAVSCPMTSFMSPGGGHIDMVPSLGFTSLIRSGISYFVAPPISSINSPTWRTPMALTSGTRVASSRLACGTITLQTP